MEPEVPMTDPSSEGKRGEFSKSNGSDPVEYIWGEGWQRQKDEGQWILHIQNLIKLKKFPIKTDYLSTLSVQNLAHFTNNQQSLIK